MPLVVVTLLPNHRREYTLLMCAALLRTRSLGLSRGRRMWTGGGKMLRGVAIREATHTPSPPPEHKVLSPSTSDSASPVICPTQSCSSEDPATFANSNSSSPSSAPKTCQALEEALQKWNWQNAWTLLEFWIRIHLNSLLNSILDQYPIHNAKLQIHF